MPPPVPGVDVCFVCRVRLAPNAALVRWRVISWVVLAAVVAYILRYNMSVAAPAMMHDLGLTEQQLGYVLGAFAWTYGLLQVPGGMVGQRFGPRLTMAAMLVGWFVTTALMAAVPHALPAALAISTISASRDLSLFALHLIPSRE